MNPDSEEGTTKGTKQHEIRKFRGISWILPNGEASKAWNPIPFVKFRVFRGFNFCFRDEVRAAPPLPLFPPVKILLFWIFEQEQTEVANGRDFQAAHWLHFQNISKPKQDNQAGDFFNREWTRMDANEEVF